MPQRLPRLALNIALCLVLAGGMAASAEDTSTGATTTTTSTPTPEQVLAGKRVWVDAACFNCHGPNGQGGNSKDFPKGPSLRTSELDSETMLEVIACGIPTTLMPAWAKGAYTERPCYGETGPVPDGTRVIGVYDKQQLADLMAYINATFRTKKKP